MSRGPNWTRYGPGTVTFHLRTGAAVRIQVESFSCRPSLDAELGEWQWYPEGPDTLPTPPAVADVVAVEHHPRPAPESTPDSDQ